MMGLLVVCLLALFYWFPVARLGHAPWVMNVYLKNFLKVH